jgi:predicted ATPase
MALANKHLLIVLDSCEHLAGEIASLVDLLRARAPNARFITTSQESLKCRDEKVYRLGPLLVPQRARLEEAAGFGAVQLFAERARSADVRFRLAEDNVAPVIDICRQLDGIPLAIELAAARLPLLGINGLHARLSQAFKLLTGGARMKLRRHQTLRAALEWSIGLLSADEQAVLRRLGVFVDGFSLELAQQVVSDERIDEWLVLDLLGHLIDKSLVIASGEAEPRYRLLETTRAFALEQLAAAGESDGILRRHAQVVCKLMAAADANCWNLSPAERKRAVRELGNVRAAVEWTMAAAGGGTLAYELLGKCWLVWLNNGLITEGVQRMLKLWPTSPDLPMSIEADFCLALSRLHQDAARDEEWHAAQRAVVLYRQLGDAGRLGDALLLVATIGLTRDQMSEAGLALREAEALVSAAAALRKQAALAATQGTYYALSGAHQPAIAAYRRQGALYHRANAEFGEYLALGNVGHAQLEAGETDAAIESLRKSVDGLRRLNAPYGLEHRLSHLAIALGWRGDDVDTLPLAHEAFDRLRSLGESFGPIMAAALHYMHRDDLRRAVLLTGYAHRAPAQRKNPRCPIDLPMQQRVRECAAAVYPTATIETWLCAGEGLTEGHAAAIAFDEAHLDTPR